MNVLNIINIKDIYREILNIMVENRDFLVNLDAVIGDGDLGLTMCTGFSAIVNELGKVDDDDIGNVITRMGMVMANAAPSTLGTLMGTAMMRAGKEVKGLKEIALKEAVNMAYAAVDSIKQRGKSEIGDKTILDSFYPATVELEKAMEESLTLQEAFKNALKGAEDGVEKTKTMMSKHGRAAYYGEKSIGRQDPGAAAGMLVVKGISNYINKEIV